MHFDMTGELEVKGKAAIAPGQQHKKFIASTGPCGGVWRTLAH